MALERVDTPIRCDESNAALHPPVRPLLLEAEAKTFQILPFLNLHPQAPSSTVRMPLERVDTPIRCAESNAALHFPVRPLLLEAEAKTFPILPFLNLHPQAPSSTIRTPLERVDTPIRCAESSAALHSPVRPLLLEAEAKTFPILRFLNQLPQTPSSTFRTPLERVDTPIRCAESNAAIHFAVPLLLLEAEAKTFRFCHFLTHSHRNPH